MNYQDFFAKTVELIRTLGVVKGVFVAFFFGAHGVIFWLYRGRLNDRQKEIDRLTGENQEYRERFTALLDKQFKIPKAKLSSSKKSSRRRLK